MSYRFNARELADTALRYCGATAPHEVASDGRHLDLALNQMDKILAQMAGENLLWWLVRETTNFSLTAGEASFSLTGAKSTDFETYRLVHLDSVVLRRTSSSVNSDTPPLEVIDRKDYDAIQNKAQAGQPECVMLDRTQPTPTLYLWPVPAVSTLDLRITYFREPIDHTRNESAADVAPDVPPAFYRCLEYWLAADLGNGIVTRINRDEYQRYRSEAESARTNLINRMNTQHRRPRFTKAHRP